MVVGGGYAGMWTCWWLREADPDLRVVLLERSVCGDGPSGRNGGFVTGYWFSLHELRRAFGDAPALSLALAAEAAVGDVGRWCEEHGIDAWFRRGGLLEVSTAPAQDAAIGKSLAACRALGVPDRVRVLAPEQVARRCRLPSFRGATLVPSDATVQPGRLARGLRARLIETGVEVFECSPVRAIEHAGGGVRVRTAAGEVRARRAVVAINAASGQLAPLRRRLAVGASHIVVTEPVPDVLEEIGWTGGEAITDGRVLIHYMRTTPDGRIAFGAGGGPLAYGARIHERLSTNAGRAHAAAADLVELFPMLAGAPVTHAWGGPIDVAPNHLPVVTSLPGGRTWAAYGFSGNGVASSLMVGRALASVLLDRRDEHARLPIVEPAPGSVPPEPLRYLGGTLVLRALARRERLEAAGTRADLPTRLVTELPRRLGIRLAR